jgi:CRP-like cAMP-binding protein
VKGLIGRGMNEKYYALLEAMPLFKGIEGEELKGMLGCLKPAVAAFKKNEYMALSGEPLSSIGILLEGQASVVKETPSGGRTVMAVLESGDTFGEIIVFSSQTQWPNSVQAMENSVVLFLDKSKLLTQCHNLCPWHKRIIENMLGIISDKAVTLNKKVEFLVMKNLRGKLAAYFLEQYRKNNKLTFMMGINRNQLADIFNVSRPSLSREMAKMKDEGIIDYYLDTVQILDIRTLEKEYMENH